MIAAVMLADIRYSIRQLLRSPVFTAAAVITLALAAAAATTVFSVYNAVVYRPSRTADWHNVFQLFQASAVHRDLEPAQIRALRDNTPEVIEAFASRARRPVVVQHQQRAFKTYVEVVDGDLAGVFRIRPRVGRLLNPSDERAGVRSAVVSAALWQRWFGGRDEVAGSESLSIDGLSFRIVGVMPMGFASGFGPDVWIPASAAAQAAEGDSRWKPMRFWWTYVRARAGVSSSGLAPSLTAALAHARTESGVHGVIARPQRSRPVAGDTQIFGLAAMLLLAACANLTNLVYARIAQRRTEIAVRMALGAGRGRIIRTFVLEIVTITVVSGTAGYVLATGATRLLQRAFPTFRRDQWGRLADLSADANVVAFAVAVAAVAALSLSAIASVHLSQLPTARALSAGAGQTATGSLGRRFRYVLVSLQVTAAVVLVMGAGLWLISARKSIDSATGFSNFRYSTSKLASLRVDMQYQGYNDTRGAAVQKKALDVARRHPYVGAAALASGLPGASRGDANRPLPMYFIADTGSRVLSGRPPSVQGSYASVSADFLETIELPLLRGRAFGPTDTAEAQLVMLVSESLAVMLFPNAEAVGQRILFNTDKQPREIVGVFKDPLVSSRARWMVAQNIIALVPLTQHYRPDVLLVVRTHHPAAAAEAVASAVSMLDPQLAIFDAASVEEALLAETAPFRATSRGMVVLGALSLLFAALGVYGVMSFFVSTRLREFGIRLALGATPFAVLRHVFREARLLLLFGLLCGVFLTAVVERLLDNRIVRMMPNAVEMWIGAIALVLMTGLVATYFPARRASRTDPIVALREL